MKPGTGQKDKINVQEKGGSARLQIDFLSPILCIDHIKSKLTWLYRQNAYPNVWPRLYVMYGDGIRQFFDHGWILVAAVDFVTMEDRFEQIKSLAISQGCGQDCIAIFPSP